MDIWRDNLNDLAELDYIPSDKQLPPHELPPNALVGALLDPAFECETVDEADRYLRKLLIHWLRFGKSKDPKRTHQKLTVKEAVAQIRAALFWLALAKDIGAGELYEMKWQGDECVKVERTKHREIAVQFYGASDPVKKTPEQDILDRVHLKRERAAKKEGRVYWRHQYAPKPEPQQGALF